MCLEYVGRITFPENLASFLDNVLREIPAVTISMHAHLGMDSFSLGFFNVDYGKETHCLYKTHHKPP